jgi:hypothetical protein
MNTLELLVSPYPGPRLSKPTRDGPLRAAPRPDERCSRRAGDSARIPADSFHHLGATSRAAQSGRRCDVTDRVKNDYAGIALHLAKGNAV